MRDAERRQAIVDEAYPRASRSAALKKLVKATLYDYQTEGALFAPKRALSARRRMGLGKTIQAITAAEIMARHFGRRALFLIVLSTSLKHSAARDERFTDRSVQVSLAACVPAFVQFGGGELLQGPYYDTVHVDLD